MKIEDNIKKKKNPVDLAIQFRMKPILRPIVITVTTRQRGSWSFAG